MNIYGLINMCDVCVNVLCKYLFVPRLLIMYVCIYVVIYIFTYLFIYF